MRWIGRIDLYIVIYVATVAGYFLKCKLFLLTALIAICRSMDSNTISRLGYVH